MNNLTKLLMAGSQATWVAVALNLRDNSGSRIPNEHAQPPMTAKLTMKQPEKATLLIKQSYCFGFSFVCFIVYGNVVAFFPCTIYSCSRNHCEMLLSLSTLDAILKWKMDTSSCQIPRIALSRPLRHSLVISRERVSTSTNEQLLEPTGDLLKEPKTIKHYLISAY